MSDPMPGTDGLMTWLSDRLGKIDWHLGELHAQTLTNRQITLEFARHATGRMDHLSNRVDTLHTKPRNGRYGWMKHVPWVKVTVLLIMAMLLVTGHLTVGELKAWMVEKVRAL